MKNNGKLPPWLKRRIPAAASFNNTGNIIRSLGIETICTNANCPNQGLCWERGTATVLILGNICTRDCKFCAVGHGKPMRSDSAEPDRVARMAKEMSLKYLVITSVNRDDLEDGGAGQFRDVINRCREQVNDLKFELLVPDFKHCMEKALRIIGDALPFVFGHNIETVPDLYCKVRPGGVYETSLQLLQKAKEMYPGIITKSSMMLGLGETDGQITRSLKDLRQAGCDRVALGQYLKPGGDSAEVIEYVEPEKFDWWRKKAQELGFSWVMSSPFTRSSYHAEAEDTF